MKCRKKRYFNQTMSQSMELEFNEFLVKLEKKFSLFLSKKKPRKI